MNEAKKEKNVEAIGCILFTFLINLAPILISLVAQILWANQFTLFLFWVFVIIGFILIAFAALGILVTYVFDKEEGADS